MLALFPFLVYLLVTFLAGHLIRAPLHASSKEVSFVYQHQVSEYDVVLKGLWTATYDTISVCQDENVQNLFDQSALLRYPLLHAKFPACSIILTDTVLEPSNVS
jgi:hypothetical protein